MGEPQTHIYEFGDFRLDAAKRLLLNESDEIIPLMPKAFDTLLYLVENNGKVIEKDELMTAIWTDTIVEENNLTQNISILRRIFGEKPGEHRFIATVPGKGYKFVADVRKISEEKEEQNFEVENKQNPDPTPNANITEKVRKQSASDKKKNRFLIFAPVLLIVLLFGLLGFYLWRQNSQISSDASIKTIAVLPFKPLIAENRNEALELGMADTLISKLSGGSENLIVRPLSAVRRYNSLEQDSLTAGRELAVEAVLDGNIQISGDRIRVSVRLIRTDDGRQLWAGQFNEDIKDIFDIQNSISDRVAEALKIRLSNKEKKNYTENFEAYQLYIRGHYHALKLILPEVQKGIDYYDRAIEIDPNYALAYAGKADAYRALSLTSDFPSSETMQKAKAAAMRAIEIDDQLAEAYAVLAWTTFFYDWDWQAAENYCLRGLEINPNSEDLRRVYAHLLSNTGRHSEALAEIKISKKLDPLSLVTNAIEGQILLYAGQTNAAIEQLQKTIELDSNFWLTHLFLSNAYMETKMYEKALLEAEKASELSLMHTQALAIRSYALAKTGKMQEAEEILNELLKLSKERYVPPYNIALAYNGVGESEKALDYLEKAYLEKNLLMVFLKVDPKWNNLRNEPRFVDLMRRMNF